MSYELDPNRIYRMPTHFGPSLGPRQGLDGKGYECVSSPRQLIVEATFEADGRSINAWLPPGFEPVESATITFAFVYMTDIEWLAGRGYNTFGVRYPARFNGAEGTVQGEFLAVLWENRAEPIITGREELGFSKLYCELPESCREGGRIRCTASWESTVFAVLDVSALAPGSPLPPVRDSAGLLHYKYLPRTGQWGQADAQYAVLTPAAAPNCRLEESERGTASIEFFPAEWHALPTLYREVSALASLEIGTCLGAQVLRTVGFKDLRDQRILR